MKLRVLAFIAICFAAFLVGCGPSNPPTAKVTGKITYKGEPVEGATVLFTSESSDLKIAKAKTAADGTFTVSTFSEGDGAMPGTYKVTVRKVESVESAEVHSESGDGPTASSGPKELLPEKYLKMETTDLTAEVTEGGENNFEFDLK